MIMYKKIILGMLVFQGFAVHNMQASFMGNLRQVGSVVYNGITGAPQKLAGQLSAGAGEGFSKTVHDSIGLFSSATKSCLNHGGAVLNDVGSNLAARFNEVCGKLPVIAIKSAIGVAGVTVAGGAVVTIVNHYIKKRFKDFSIVKQSGVGNGQRNFEAMQQNMVINDDNFAILSRDFNSSTFLPIMLLSGPYGVGKRFFITHYAPLSGMNHIFLNAAEMIVRYGHNSVALMNKIKKIIDDAKVAENKTLIVIYGIDAFWQYVPREQPPIANFLKEFIIRPINELHDKIMLVGTTDQSWDILTDDFKKLFTEHYEFKVSSWDAQVDTLIQFYMKNYPITGNKKILIETIKTQLKKDIWPVQIAKIVAQEYEKSRKHYVVPVVEGKTVKERMDILIAQQQRSNKWTFL